MNLTIYTDGGSRGNPGPAASAFVVYDAEQKVLHQAAIYLGRATNNTAEYMAVLESYKWLNNEYGNSDVTLEFIIDSELVVRQLTGVYKIKSPDLLPLAREIKSLEKNFTRVTYTHVLREKNKLADQLVNECLDLQA